MEEMGFTISDDLSIGVKLIILPFETKVTGQFAPENWNILSRLLLPRFMLSVQWESSRKIDSLRWKILSMMNNFENMFKSCSYLVTFKQPFLTVQKWGKGKQFDKHDNVSCPLHAGQFEAAPHPHPPPCWGSTVPPILHAGHVEAAPLPTLPVEAVQNPTYSMLGMLRHVFCVCFVFSGSAPTCNWLKALSVPKRFPWNSIREENAGSDSRRQRALKHAKRGLTSEENTSVTAANQCVGAETVISSTALPAAAESSTQTDFTQVLSKSTSTDISHQPLWSVYNFVNDNEAIHYYTGLEKNYMRFCCVLHTLGPAAFNLNYIFGAIHTICVFDRFFTTLIKLCRQTPNFE